MSRRSLDVAERVRRLLILVPEVVKNDDGVPVSILAEKLGVDPEDLPEQLERLMMIGKPPFNPDDLLELYVEDDRVFAVLHQSLDRPPRLTHDEALALAVGAQCVRSGVDEGPGSLESALEKIEQAMASEERVRYRRLSCCIELEQGAALLPDVRSVLWKALESGRKVAMTYYSASRDSLGERTVEPYGILSHRGYWYLVAGPDGPDGYKLYRLDRIREARHVGEAGSVEVPASLDLMSLSPVGISRGARDGATRFIRVKGEKARHVRERFSEEQAEATDDGAAELRFAGMGDDWLAAFVIALGHDADMVEPKRLRRRVLEEAGRIRARYG